MFGARRPQIEWEQNKKEKEKKAFSSGRGKWLELDRMPESRNDEKEIPSEALHGVRSA